MKVISVDTGWGSKDVFVIEKNNDQYCVEIKKWDGDADEVYENLTGRKVRKDSKLHTALCAFAQSQLKLIRAFMYEIIWSNFYNKHIIRVCDSISTVNVLFVGTLDQCQAKLKNYISH